MNRTSQPDLQEDFRRKKHSYIEMGSFSHSLKVARSERMRHVERLRSEVGFEVARLIGPTKLFTPDNRPIKPAYKIL